MTRRVIPAEIKILHILEGAAEISTAQGRYLLMPGMALALGAGEWCQMRPRQYVRLWAVYSDERFLCEQMAWFLPDKTRLRAGVHPHDWDGSPLVLHPGVSTLRRVEPIWRQLSVLGNGTKSPEVVAVRTVELFAGWVGLVTPAFLAPDAAANSDGTELSQAGGLLMSISLAGHVGRAVQLLRDRMAESWTTTALARSVAVSRTHLTRLFVACTGFPPMRYLTEIRLTEFTRLIDETDWTVARAAGAVGWRDPRVASRWFSRRYGITPSQYRASGRPEGRQANPPHSPAG